METSAPAIGDLALRFGRERPSALAVNAMATMDRWVASQLTPWRDLALSASELEVRLREFAAGSNSICLLQIMNGAVEIDPTFLAERPHFGDPAHPMGTRALAYRTLLHDALYTFGGSGSALIAIHLDDLFITQPDLPIFCFQKHRDARGILLPDIDFVNSLYYARADNHLVDSIPFDAKLRQAVFVGSTTGSLPLTSDNVRNGTNARIKSATFFREQSRVTFCLPNIVQVDGPETRKLIEDLDIGGRAIDWPEQYQFRFIISLDGNGATCSRVALALQSNAVLMKYDSPHRLHYFDDLFPWRHYIPVIVDKDVLAALNDEAMSGLYLRIARNSTAFSRTYLTRLSLFWYTANLLGAYASTLETVSRAEMAPGPLLVRIDGFAHLQGHSIRWADPHGWLGDQNLAVAIEGFGLVAPVEIGSADLRYCGILKNGRKTDWMGDRHFCSAPHSAEPLHGVVVELSGPSGRRFQLSYRAAYADGFISSEVASGTELYHSAPLVGLRFALRALRS